MSKKNFCTMYPNRILLWFAYRGHLCFQLPWKRESAVCIKDRNLWQPFTPPYKTALTEFKIVVKRMHRVVLSSVSNQLYPISFQLYPISHQLYRKCQNFQIAYLLKAINWIQINQFWFNMNTWYQFSLINGIDGYY